MKYALFLAGAAIGYYATRPRPVVDDVRWLDDQPPEIVAALAAHDFQMWTEEMAQ